MVGNCVAKFRGDNTDGIPTPLKLAAVASAAAVLFQSELASVTTTSAENGNMLACFEGALLSTKQSDFRGTAGEAIP